MSLLHLFWQAYYKFGNQRRLQTRYGIKRPSFELKIKDKTPVFFPDADIVHYYIGCLPYRRLILAMAQLGKP